MSEYVQLVETSPEIALYRSRSLPLVTEIVERAFRGDNARRVPYRDMIRIIRTVIDEFRDASGDPEAYPRAPEYYLKSWIGDDRNLEDGLWFLRDLDRDGDWVRLHGHARRVIEQVMSLNTPFRSFGSSTMHDLFRKVLDTSARLDGNRERMLTNARAERDRLDQRIAELERGEEVVAVDDGDAVSSAQEILKMMSELRVAISEVPDLLRQINRENHETLNRSEGRAGDLIREVMERGARVRDDANGYRFVHEVYRLHLDEDRSRDLNLAIRTILDRVAPLISPSEERRMAGFLRELQLISAGITEQDYVDMYQQHEYLQSAIFQRHLHEGRIMSRALETMYRVREELNPTIRDPRLAGLGLEIDQPLSLLRASGFRLSEVQQTVPVRHYRTPALSPAEDGARKAAALRVAAREAMADIKEVRRSLDLILSRRERVSLSEALTLFPPEGGAQEVASWLILAASRVPASYPKGAVTEVRFPDGSEPPIVCLNPVFTRTGQPGEGLNEAVLYAEANRLLTFNIQEETADA